MSLTRLFFGRRRSFNSERPSLGSMFPGQLTHYPCSLGRKSDMQLWNLDGNTG